MPLGIKAGMRPGSVGGLQTSRLLSAFGAKRTLAGLIARGMTLVWTTSGAARSIIRVKPGRPGSDAQVFTNHRFQGRPITCHPQ
jgi:hypothetical protein